MTLACGGDNRLVEQSGWTTRKRADGRTEWIPPPQLDTGQPRVNNYHHPEKYLLPEDDEGPLCPMAQQDTSTKTVLAVTVVTMSSIAPGAPESMREKV
jgi:hypothetical protein